MDMPREGYTSLTLRDEAAELIQMEGAVHPSGQSGFVVDMIGFLKENREAFRVYVTTNKGSSS